MFIRLATAHYSLDIVSLEILWLTLLKKELSSLGFEPGSQTRTSLSIKWLQRNLEGAAEVCNFWDETRDRRKVEWGRQVSETIRAQFKTKILVTKKLLFRYRLVLVWRSFDKRGVNGMPDNFPIQRKDRLILKGKLFNFIQKQPSFLLKCRSYVEI